MFCLLRVMVFVLAAIIASTAGAQDTDATLPPETPVEESPVPETPTVFTVENVLAAVKAQVRETYTGTLTTVASGDLVTVNRNGVATQLRLYGIDCPEPGQEFAEESRAQTAQSVLDTSVSVHVLTVDSQEVPVALVFDGTGGSLSHNLVRDGLAWWDQRNAAKDTMLRKLNAEALVAGKGIFADPAALAPWDYRNSHELPDFTYALEAAVPEKKEAPAASAAEGEEPRSLSAKGSMTESRPRPAAPPAAGGSKPAGGTPLSLPGIPNDLVKDVDLGGLMMRHQPRIATDASGRPLGLTANNVNAIPYASQYGFQEGDIVSKVNGIAIESEAQIFSLIPQFQNVRNFQVEVLRNGQTVNIPINVK